MEIKKYIKNYRPISSLNCLNTVFEKLLSVELNSFITSHSIIDDRQYGFRKGCSTNDAFIKLLDQTYKTVNDNNYFGIISLDLCKAFNTVDHSVLLTKLYDYCIIRSF